MLWREPHHKPTFERDHASYHRTDQKHMWKLRGLIHHLKRVEEGTGLHLTAFQEGSPITFLRQIRIKRRRNFHQKLQDLP